MQLEIVSMKHNQKRYTMQKNNTLNKTLKRDKYIRFK